MQDIDRGVVMCIVVVGNRAPTILHHKFWVMSHEIFANAVSSAIVRRERIVLEILKS